MIAAHASRRTLIGWLGAAALSAPVVLGRAPLAAADNRGTPEASPAGMGLSGTGAAYMTIRNAGSEADRLVSGTTDVAQTVEIHEVVEQGGVMQMRPLANGLEIPPGGAVTLEPGGYHVMLIGLKEDLTLGKRFDLRLRFARAGEATVPIEVRARAEPASGATPEAPVTAGDVTIENAWSRPAPALGGTGTPAAATPAAS